MNDKNGTKRKAEKDQRRAPKTVSQKETKKDCRVERAAKRLRVKRRGSKKCKETRANMEDEDDEDEDEDEDASISKKKVKKNTVCFFFRRGRKNIFFRGKKELRNIFEHNSI